MRLWIALGLVLLFVSVAAGAMLVRQRALEAEFQQAREAYEARRYGVASQRFSRLSERWTNDGEVLLLLGNTHFFLGKRDDAILAWSKVPASSPHFSKAALSAAVEFMSAGRYSAAEERLLAALDDSRATPQLRRDIERTLVRLYRAQGRFHDVRPLTRASWCRAPRPAELLKELWGFDLANKPVEALKSSLSTADKADDRVWLGWANLAILTGQFAEARPWLERCLSRRPEDPAVWQAQLDLALATNDVDGFWSAAHHLPASRFDKLEILTYRAWLAAIDHDLEREERALSSLIECEPGNAKALERLAALNLESGRKREAEALHRRRDEVNQAREKCRQILEDGLDVPNRARILADLSAKLGRAFDAEAWTILADAGLGNRGGDPPGSSLETTSPLRDSFLARATALSARYAISDDQSPNSSPMLSERLADLRPAIVARPSTTAPAEVSAKHHELQRPLPDFVDDAQLAGLHFQLDSGHTEERLLPETMSGGVGLIDFDGDGWLDVYCVQGGALSDAPEIPRIGPTPAGDRLFRNQRNGTFEDVTAKTGIAKVAWGQGYGHGVSVGDFDNDGRPDLFVTRLMTYSLYRNQGNGTFEDVTKSAGLAGRRDHPTSAAWADLDNDGDLDLYVCHYMIWDPAHPTICKDGRGTIYHCHPLKVSPAPDHVFRNDGGKFVDVTAASGCAETNGRGMGVVAADLDGDGLVDLFVANDSTVNDLWRNQGGFRFEEIGIQAGVGASVQGGYQAGMGVACGDLDGDGRPDLMITNFYGEGTTLFHNMGDGLFTDWSAPSGIALATKFLLGFGIAMADVTNHGRLDVMTTNGHVDDNRANFPYRMPTKLYVNRPDGRLIDVSDKAGAPWKVERVGRGLAAGDLDNDGRVDAIIIAQNEPLAYFHNRSKSVGHFVTFRLEGTKSNRDGVGASVTVTAGGRRQVAQRVGGGSYQSSNDPRLHFGLSASNHVESVVVHWPSGQIDKWNDLAADTGYLLHEGHADALLLNGFQQRPGSAQK